MFNKSEIMRKAHQAAREQFELWPWQRKTMTYRQMFASQLGNMYQAARWQVPAQVSELNTRRTLIEFKTRLNDQDNQTLRNIDCQLDNYRRAA
ncbi:MAG: hypothetical protein ABJO09_01050 [Hyphomicrobiales bacterium]